MILKGTWISYQFKNKEESDKQDQESKRKDGLDEEGLDEEGSGGIQFEVEDQEGIRIRVELEGQKELKFRWMRNRLMRIRNQ